MLRTKDDGFSMPTNSVPPPVDEDFQGPFGIPDFSPHLDRQSIFSDTEFILYDQSQLDRVRNMIELGDGTVTLASFEDRRMKYDIVKENRVVVEPKDLEMHSVAWRNVVKILHQRNKRPICEDEIGWAVVYNSSDHFANPNVALSVDALCQSNLAGSSCNLQEKQETNDRVHPRLTATVEKSLEDIFDDFIGETDSLPPVSKKKLQSAPSSPTVTLGKRARSETSALNAATPSDSARQPNNEVLPKLSTVQSDNTGNIIRQHQDREYVADMESYISEQGEEIAEEERQEEKQQEFLPGKKYLKFQSIKVTVIPATALTENLIDREDAEIVDTKRFKKASVLKQHGDI
ncbi:hypothetical protein EC973_005790 [Apophysomyces ossiformis]|uniref:Nibrin second BRCT domain-containing protein n=1 Tax=Apophysomyces ossiformis TaxID=679940 RepID=A0A8H7BEQ2_9FUNG|nr:hypothetical protein EC973_005790 [Apophysomyces ossiformis]